MSCAPVGSILVSVIKSIGGEFLSFLSSKWDVSVVGAVIPHGCSKTTICNKVESNDTLMLDMDQEVFSELNVEEKSKVERLIQEHSNRLNAVLSPKANTVLSQVKQSLNKNIKRIIILSSDYNLLKLLNVPKIKYYMASKDLWESIVSKMKNDQTKARFLEYSIYLHDQLKKDKESKLQIFKSLDELQSVICEDFSINFRV